MEHILYVPFILLRFLIKLNKYLQNINYGKYMNKFDTLYNKIICEMTNKEPDETTIIIDAINDEFIPEGIILVDRMGR